MYQLRRAIQLDYWRYERQKLRLVSLIISIWLPYELIVIDHRNGVNTVVAAATNTQAASRCVTPRYVPEALCYCCWLPPPSNTAVVQKMPGYGSLAKM